MVVRQIQNFAVYSFLASNGDMSIYVSKLIRILVCWMIFHWNLDIWGYSAVRFQTLLKPFVLLGFEDSAPPGRGQPFFTWFPLTPRWEGLLVAAEQRQQGWLPTGAWHRYPPLAWQRGSALLQLSTWSHWHHRGGSLVTVNMKACEPPLGHLFKSSSLLGRDEKSAPDGRQWSCGVHLLQPSWGWSQGLPLSLSRHGVWEGWCSFSRRLARVEAAIYTHSLFCHCPFLVLWLERAGFLLAFYSNTLSISGFHLLHLQATWGKNKAKTRQKHQTKQEIRDIKIGRKR